MIDDTWTSEFVGSAIVLDVSEPGVALRRALQCPTNRPPLHDILDAGGEFEVLVGDALGGMRHQPDFDPGIGEGHVRVVPGGLGKVADRVDHHQRALPGMRPVGAPQPAALKLPVRQRGLQPLFDLGVAVDALAIMFSHLFPPCVSAPLPAVAAVWTSMAHFNRGTTMNKTELAPVAELGADRVPAATLVEIAASARLHLGFLDLNGGLGRRFGSIGMAVDAPSLRLELRRSRRPAVVGPEQDRAAAWLAVLERQLGLPGPHDLRIREAIPAHAGLGSGTQLALALGAALRGLYGMAEDPQAAGTSADALAILDRLLDQGDEPLAILGAFSWQLRRLAQIGRAVASGVSHSTALEAAGVIPWQRTSVETLLQHLGRRRLAKLFDWLVDADSR